MPLYLRNALIALVLTTLIMGTVWYAVGYLDNRRLAELSTLETQLSLNALSLETQLALLEKAPCDTAKEGLGLAAELSDLGSRLSFLESRLGSDHPQVLQVKKQYTLLEIRDYLLTEQLARACTSDPVTVLYFYGSAKDCPECDRAGFALSYLRDTYPALRVYSFDYGLDLGALKTLIAVRKIKGDTLPAFVIDGKTHYGFESPDALKELLPKRLLDKAATSTAAKP